MIFLNLENYIHSYYLRNISINIDAKQEGIKNIIIFVKIKTLN